MRQLNKLTSRKDGGKGDGGVLVTQERMADADADKVDANAKADAPDASDAYNSSKIETPKIDLKRGIGKPCVIVIALY